MLARSAILIAIVVGLQLVSGAATRAQDAADIADGRRLFLQKGNCQACHGWAGDGRKMDSQMPDGANLRALTIDREVLTLTIRCGRPGTGMPAFERLAYSDGRCRGLKLADLRARGLEMPDPAATLAPNEVGLLVDFLLAKVVGKGEMTRAQCAEYWGSAVEACDELPQ
jgi:hypothetical protein